MGPRLHPVHALVPAVVLLGLLAVLGGLQYRWLSQVGQAERTRLQHDARRRVEALAQDFDREITRAYVMLQVPPGPASPGTGDAFAERWERWQARAPYPGIVSAVYVLEPGGTPPPLWRFDPVRRAFAEAEWSAALEPLRRLLAASAAGQPPGPPMPVLPDVPALVSPMPDVLAINEDGRPDSPGDLKRRVYFHRRAGPWPSWNCTVVVLDRERLMRLLTDLSARHLSGASGPEYDVTLLAGSGGAVLWSSGAARARGDAEAPALQVRFDDLERSLLEGLGDPSAADQGAPAHFRVRLATGVVATVGGKGEAGASGWRLVLAHRAGSVDALAASLRRRNLALSFGILGVLAASLVQVVVSSQRARRLAARQMAFVAGVSHELRTPVAVIRSAAENLADGVVADPPQVRRYGAVIREQGTRLTGMVEQVLALAGAQARAREPQAVAPADLVRAALQDHEAALRAAGVPLQLDLAADLPEVGGDPDALRRAVGNLIANAGSHAQGSALRVAARRADDGGVEIDVTDRGPGIDPADLPHVFEAFYRGRRAVADQVPGTGLGLSVVRGVTEAHGGRVSVRSRPGDGATFILHLPAYAPR
jgi:signal transduction histidine kinase